MARCLLKQRKHLTQPGQQSSVTDLQLPRATHFRHKLLLCLLRASSPQSNVRHVQPPQAARFQHIHMALKPQGHSQELSPLWNLQPSLAARCREKPGHQLKRLTPQSNLQHLQPPTAAQFRQKQLTRLQPLRQRWSSLSNRRSSQPAQYPQKQLGLLGTPTPQLALTGLQPPHVAQCRHKQPRHLRHHREFSLRHLQSSPPPPLHQNPL